jgi:hypothetical protein
MQKTKSNRYDIKQEIDGSWDIFDIFTGTPVVVAGKRMIGFREDTSRQLVAMLNAQNILRRASLEF